MSAPCSLTKIILFVISFSSAHIFNLFPIAFLKNRESTEENLHHLSQFLKRRINFHPKANKSRAIKHNILNQIREYFCSVQDFHVHVEIKKGKSIANEKTFIFCSILTHQRQKFLPAAEVLI